LIGVGVELELFLGKNVKEIANTDISALLTNIPLHARQLRCLILAMFAINPLVPTAFGVLHVVVSEHRPNATSGLGTNASGATWTSH